MFRFSPAGALCAALLLLHGPAQAHEGHDHAEAPGEQAAALTGTIELSDPAIHNLGIETAQATLSPQSETLTLYARIVPMHNKEVVVSYRAAGRVTELLAREGQMVKKGQPVIGIQPLLLGTSPLTLTSPIDGIVVSHDVAIGQSVTPEMPLYRLADLSQVLVHGIAYEQPELLALQAGQRVTVTSDMAPGRRFEGMVHHLGAGLDERTQALNVYAMVENPERRLLPGTRAMLDIHLGEAREALTVPARAVLGEMGNYFAFVREGNRFERRVLTLGEPFGDRQEIIDGVLPDEEVVVTGNYQLQYAQPSPHEEEGDAHGHTH